MEQERKNLPLEVKSIDENGTFEGYAAVFGNRDSHGDVIVPGAFDYSLKSVGKPQFRIIHKPVEIGEWKTLAPDTHGLFVVGKFDLSGENRVAGLAYSEMKKGNLTGLSIGYRPLAADWQAETKTRTLREVMLGEISAVFDPSNPLARVTAVKSVESLTIREFEAALRDVMGFSASEAKRIASHGFKARDVPDESEEVRAVIEQFKQKYL